MSHEDECTFMIIIAFTSA